MPKYIKRWKGKDGKWNYQYSKKKTSGRKNIDNEKNKKYNSNIDRLVKQQIGVSYGSEEEYRKTWEESCKKLNTLSDNTSRSYISRDGRKIEKDSGGLSWKKIESIDIKGQKVSSPEDVAVLLEHFRNPRIEIFHIMYGSESGEILSHNCFTSGLPSITLAMREGSAEKSIEEIKKTAEKLGAKKVWIAHNHPSGNPIASRQDKNVTDKYQEGLGELFSGHVIIDHDKYNFLKESEYDIVRDNILPLKREFEKYKLPETSSIVGSLDIAETFKDVLDQGPNITSVVSLNPKNNILSWSYSSKDTEKLDYYEYMRHSGGDKIILVTNDEEVYAKEYENIKNSKISDGYILDVIYTEEGYAVSAFEEMRRNHMNMDNVGNWQSPRAEENVYDIISPEGKVNDFKKSRFYIYDRMMKGRGYSVGTIREWKGKKYKKVSEGKWMRYYEGQNRGQKQALRNTLRSIDNANSMEELVEIVKKNRSRFMDENGRPAAVVENLFDAVNISKVGISENKKKDLEKKVQSTITSVMSSPDKLINKYMFPEKNVSKYLSNVKKWVKRTNYVGTAEDAMRVYQSKRTDTVKKKISPKKESAIKSLSKEKKDVVLNKNFLSWFGDWVNNPQEASKVVSKNDIPEEQKPVNVFHGTSHGGFTEFSKEKSAPGLYGEGFYFTEDKNIANEYTKKDSDPKKDIHEARGFLKEGKKIQYIDKSAGDKIIKKINSGYLNPNWDESILKAFDDSYTEKKGYDIEKLFREYTSNQKKIGKDDSTIRLGKEGLFDKIKKEVPELSVIVPDPQVFDVYLNIKNPLDLDGSMKQAESLLDKMEEDNKKAAMKDIEYSIKRTRESIESYKKYNPEDMEGAESGIYYRGKDKIDYITLADADKMSDEELRKIAVENNYYLNNASLTHFKHLPDNIPDEVIKPWAKEKGYITPYEHEGKTKEFIGDGDIPGTRENLYILADMINKHGLSTYDDITGETGKKYIPSAPDGGPSLQTLSYILSDGWGFGGGEKMNEWAKENGYDGLSHTGGWNFSGGGGPKHKVWIAFEPNQIKSSEGNSGDFDPESNDITKSIPNNKTLDEYKSELKNFLKKKYSGKIKKSIITDSDFLRKARGFSPGTIREWRGKKYKKTSSGKWVRYYQSSEGRGVNQALRNTLKKIDNAQSMEELVSIVKENMERFHDENGKTSPIVKELFSAVRGNESGKKIKGKEKPKKKKKKSNDDDKTYSVYVDGEKEASGLSYIEALDLEKEKISRGYGESEVSVSEEKKETLSEITETAQKYEKQIKELQLSPEQKGKLNALRDLAVSGKDNDAYEVYLEKILKDKKSAVSGSTIEEKYTSSPSVEGDQDDIYVGDEEVSGTWKLVEADAPSASHNENTFQKTEGFPTNKDGSTINDRDYEKDRSAQETVLSVASNYDGRALSFDSPVVVSKEGVVISGNNRTMSSKIAARKGTDKLYIKALGKRAKKYGFSQDDLKSFNNPRVVFEIDIKDNEYTTKQFAKFNQGETKAMNPVETAVKASKIVTPEVVEGISNKINEFETLGELYANKKASTDIFNTLEMGGIINEFSRPQYITEDGITGAGKEFLETMMIGSVVNESNIRSLSKPGGKSVRKKLVRAMSQLVQNKAMGGYSVTDDLNDAINVMVTVSQNKDKYSSVDDYAKQKDMFGEDSKVAIELARKLEMKEKDFADFMSYMNANLKEGSEGQADIFFGGVESKDDILNRILKIKKSIEGLMKGLFNVIPEDVKTLEKSIKAGKPLENNVKHELNILRSDAIRTGIYKEYTDRLNEIKSV